MKHSFKITLILLSMFLVTQLIGIFVINTYSSHELPYNLSPPEESVPEYNLISIIFAIFLGVVIIFALMSLKAEMFFRIWFFFIVSLAIAVSLTAILISTDYFIKYASTIAIILALILTYVKIFIRDLRIHNVTELLVYPGVAALFVPLLNIWTVVVLLFLISLYDIYAVWHSGIMQKMAKYQIQNLKIFSGFFIPYLGQKERSILEKNKKSKKKKKIKISIAILGGGDVVFPIILAGVVLIKFGFISSLIIAIGSTISLAYLFYVSEKGKFYPAMPFISIGCYISLLVVYLYNYLLLL